MYRYTVTVEMKFLATVAIASLGFASAACPNLCSGHGDCIIEDRCTCNANWQGADCSERVCAFGKAWVDAPSATDTAHWYAECSNKGICDRTTGECACFEGYTGKGCRRSTCPNDCSGHGTCYYLNQLSASGDRGKFSIAYTETGAAPNGGITYSEWDGQKIQGCVCDAYYEGADCSLRQCPRGDNILTLSNTKNQVQEICFTDSAADKPPAGEITLTYTDLFGGVWETRPIKVGYTTAGGPTVATTDAAVVGVAANIEAALEALPNEVIPAVTVTATLGTNKATTAVNGYCAQVTFSDEANSGAQNYLKANFKGCNRAGCAPKYLGLSAGSASENNINVAVSDITDVSIYSYKEKAVCSEHGLCDSSTGLCKCFHGYYNLDCSAQTILV